MTNQALEPRVPSKDRTLVTVSNLSIRFPRSYGNVPVIDSANFAIRAGEVVGLVGESGSGKTLISLSLLGLFPRGSTVSGHVDIDGRNVVALPEKERRKLRGSSVAMVYQDALASLNPSVTIGRQYARIARLGACRSTTELLDLVRLPDANRILASYPHQLSGGQRQRVLIAFALARYPELIVADEPTTALDVTVQAQVLDVLLNAAIDAGSGLLLVSHDLGVIRHTADRAMVMYAGQLLESGLTTDLITRPMHRYTSGLVTAGRSLERADDPVAVIDGAVPSPRHYPAGCRFVTRCPAALSACSAKIEPVTEGERWHTCKNPSNHSVP
ncbi:ABC transporter ATP-binding protein [Qaidamihabitans albus]|uniref:ABC transporter ATP-binding protein n=1 Tax=Qaidamihabitans albus TaxID=2795733 RepID=UPI0018F1B491|nr:ABC transporter ATP-binding protein [Qaidamihabitans albus]